MCNAWNHPPDCACGWGGAGHLGRRGGWAHSDDQSGFWGVPTITQTLKSYVTPNAACPVCGESVFFYQSPNGGRVFFDELGPPWPKHPCTDSTSTPKSLNVSPPTERLSNPSWKTAGWFPFYISSISNSYKSVLEITGTVEEKSVTLFLRKGAHIPTSQITEKCIAFIRRGASSNFELSLIIGTRRSTIIVTVDASSTRVSETITALKSEARNQKSRSLPPFKEDAWLQKKCSKCDTGKVFYLPHWSVLPKKCNRCRLRELDLRELFENFLAAQAQLKIFCRTLKEKQKFVACEPLREKVRNLLTNQQQGCLANICERDKELSLLAFRLIKEHLQRRPHSHTRREHKTKQKSQMQVIDTTK